MGRSLRMTLFAGAAAAALAIVTALPAAAVDASNSSGAVAVPGGAGSITCTLFYHQSKSGASVRPYDIGCENDTNRHVTWNKTDYFHAGGHLCGGFDVDQSKTIDPHATVYFSISLCAPWEPKAAVPYFESHLSARGAPDVVVYNTMY